MLVFFGLNVPAFFLIPTGGWSVLVLRGLSTFLYSKEGVTEGDPLSMLAYVIGTLPLIHSLRDPGRWTWLWYADDASAGETLLSCIIGLMYFALVVPVLAITLSPQRVLVLLMNHGGVKLLQSLVIWGFRW